MSLFGSISEVGLRPSQVRLSLNSGHAATEVAGPLYAKTSIRDLRCLPRIEIARRIRSSYDRVDGMVFQRFTTGINREDLTQDCLQELRLWPGCETVERVAVLADTGGKFAVRVVSYGLAKKRNADRALRCIQREKARRFHFKVE